MTDEDLRDCFAMFAMVGFLFRDSYGASNLAEMAYYQADKMLEARKKKEKEDEEDIGIVAVVPKRTRKR